MKKILYPTDTSTASKNAFLFALHIARAYQAKIIAFHFYDTSESDFQTSFEQLNQNANILGYDDVEIQHITKSPENRSVELLVKKEAIDIVIIATKGTESTTPVMAGVLISEIVTNSKSLVLVIPEGKKLADGIKNITFTTRFREKDKKALNKCLEFASITGAKVNCLYIKTSKSDISDTKIQEWKTVYQNHNIEFHIIESNEVNKPILEYIEQNQSDLLAILTYKRNFIEEMFRGSTAQKLSYYASVPVLVIHESDL